MHACVNCDQAGMAAPHVHANVGMYWAAQPALHAADAAAAAARVVSVAATAAPARTPTSTCRPGRSDTLPRLSVTGGACQACSPPPPVRTHGTHGTACLPRACGHRVAAARALPCCCDVACACMRVPSACAVAVAVAHRVAAPANHARGPPGDGGGVGGAGAQRHIGGAAAAGLQQAPCCSQAYVLSEHRAHGGSAQADCLPARKRVPGGRRPRCSLQQRWSYTREQQQEAGCPAGGRPDAVGAASSRPSGDLSASHSFTPQGSGSLGGSACR